MADSSDVWIFAKSHAMEIKRDLQSILGLHYNIIAVPNAGNNLVEALYSKKEVLKYLTFKDNVVIVGGLDEGHLIDNQFAICDFCNSLKNTNIILCDGEFSAHLKSLEVSNRNVRIVYHRKYSPAQDIIDHVCRLIQKEIQKQGQGAAGDSFGACNQPQPSTSFISSSYQDPFRNLISQGNAGDTFRKTEFSFYETNISSNAYGDTANTTLTKKNLKRQREFTPSSKRANIKPIYRTRNTLNVVHQNINGLMPKEDKLIDKIRHMSSMNVDLDIICLTEHNMVDDDVDEVDIPNFELANTIIRDERRGGSCILLRDDLKFRVLPRVEVNNHPDFVECCAVKLVDLNVIVICIYRPPKYGRQDVEEFLDELDVILKRYKKQKLIICGDFNIDILKNDKTCRDFREVIDNYNMKLAIKDPSRMGSNACIDNIIHNLNGIASRVLNWNLSDHSAQFLRCTW